MHENPNDMKSPMPGRPRSASRRHDGLRFPRGFTLIEMLVVIAIIIILLGSVLVAGGALLTRSKIRNTQAVLQVIESALDEFQRQKPSILGAKQNTAKGIVRYSNRYGAYPPDEVEMFTVSGLPGSTGGSLSVGMAEFYPAPTTGGNYPPMKFYTRGNPVAELEHRDLSAMLLAIDMYCEPAAMLLSKIPGGNRSPGLLDPNGNPLQFLEDAGGDQKWDPTQDRQLPFAILDSWGQPLSYMAQRDYTGKPDDILSNNAVGDWNKASTEMIRLNNGRPIIMSWGPDGEDQLTKEAQQDPTASLVGDWDDNSKIDNPFNEDNVFTDETLNKKLAENEKLAEGL